MYIESVSEKISSEFDYLILQKKYVQIRFICNYEFVCFFNFLSVQLEKCEFIGLFCIDLELVYIKYIFK